MFLLYTASVCFISALVANVHVELASGLSSVKIVKILICVVRSAGSLGIVKTLGIGPGSGTGASLHVPISVFSGRAVTLCS